MKDSGKNIFMWKLLGLHISRGQMNTIQNNDFFFFFLSLQDVADLKNSHNFQKTVIHAAQ